MDKMKGLAKGGWHPSGDKQIHRDSWKSDLKGIATGRNKDPYEEQRNHQSAPLSTLKDPDAFGPPPKHTAYYDSNGVSRTDTGLTTTSATSSGRAARAEGPRGGWGAPAVESGYAQRKREREEQERLQSQQEQAEAATTRGPYRVDTTGLRTDNLPKPPLRRGTPSGEESPQTRSGPSLPPRVPPRQATLPSTAVAPNAKQQIDRPPGLPPRQNEYPDEFTPAAPPPYQEALQQPQTASTNPALINQSAVQRLGQAGISVPGFGIASSPNTTETANTQSQGLARDRPQASQLSELQQRFARMNTGAAAGSENTTPAVSTSLGTGIAAAAVAAQKKPPPPPPKKAELHAPAATSLHNSGLGVGSVQHSGASAPPPVPVGSKPKPS